MATRMQQRRGTAAQWTGANPILAAGEIGFETDTGKFKIGNGSSTWSSLNYYVDANAILDGAPGVLDTLNELAAALGDDPAFITTVATNLSNHESDTSNVHGIANTANLVTLSGTQELTNKTLTGASIDSTTTAVTQSSIDNTTKIATTEFVQGRINSVISASPELLNTLSELAAAINDDPDFSTTVANNIATKVSKAGDTMTGALTLPGDPTENLHAATKAYVDGGLSSHESDTTNVHGIADTAALTTQAYVDNALSAHQSDTTNVHGIADTDALATKDYADSALNAHQADTTNVHGIADTSALVTQTYVDTALSTHISDTTNVHGIDDTAELATKSYADAAVSTHGSDTTNVHGIGDTANLATQAYADGAVSTHNSDTTDVHGIADTSVLVVTSDSRLSDDRTPSDNTVSTIKIVDSAVTADKIASDAVTTIKIVNSAVTADKIAGDAVTTAKIEDGAVTSAKIADGTIVNADINASAAIAQSKIADLTTDLADKAPLASPTFTGTVSGITKTMVGLGNVDNTADADKPVSTATQTALDLKANLAGPTFTGTTTAAALTVTGNLTVQGTTTTVSATDLVVSDPLIYIGEDNNANLVDLGVVASFDNGTYQHTGLVRDASDGKWKLFKGVTDEPTTTVNFTQGSMDDLKVGAFEATTVTPSSGVVFSDGTQTKEGVASRTPIIAKTDSYTLSALTERDSLIEVNKASAATITIPTNATVAYPVGTSIDILQTGAGQVTIAGASGVTVNGTPGLKLRTQWSSATLFKRATDTWVVMGDLSA
jgi:Major tropism determinant N-terminal domain